MATDVSIVNAALIRLGEATITALSDDVKAARLANEIFADQRDAVLRAHPWNFAARRALISGLDRNDPDWGFARKYILPDGSGGSTKALRLLRLNDHRDDFKVENGFVVTDAGAADANSLENPDDFTAGDWDDINTVTVTGNQIAGPDGSSDADLIADADASNRSGLSQDQASITDDEGYWFLGASVKANTSARCAIQAKFTGGTSTITAFNELTFATPAVAKGGAQAGRIADYGYLSLDDSWYWLWMVVRNNGTGNTTLTWEVYPTGLSGGAASDQTSIYAVDANMRKVTPLDALYVAQDTDYNNWDVLARDALAARLAMELAEPLGKSSSLIEQMARMYDDKLREARSIDGQEGSGDVFEASTWLDSRV